MRRIQLILALGLIALAAAACDRLPDLGGKGQPCFGNGDCDDGLTCNTETDTCESGCSPDCSNKCGGVDDGCGGACGDECWEGYICEGQGCVHCEMDQACGPNCDDCLLGDTDWDCVSDGTAGYRCGCSDLAHCASGVCGQDGFCECTPDCTGLGCGDSDGCNGICDGNCGAGQYCDGPSCADCVVEVQCGLGCEDCTAEATNRACVSQGGTEAMDHFCGCETDLDCDDGETCDGAFGLCAPGGLCADPSACGQDGDCVADSHPAGMACLDDGAGGCGCGCMDENDCTDSGTMRCANQACCTSLCGNSCAGEEDGGCPGLFCDTCPSGSTCYNDNCIICNTPAACGDLCALCADSPAGPECVDEGGDVYHCGCNQDADCLHGLCDESVCTSAVLSEWVVDESDTVINALAITPADAGLSFPVVAIGGEDATIKHHVRLWTLDGDLGPTADLTLGGGTIYHAQAVWDLAFAADGDLFSSDLDGVWMHWSNETDSWNATPARWDTPSGSPAFWLAAGGQDTNLVVAATAVQPAFGVRFFDASASQVAGVDRNGSVTDLAVKQNADLAVITCFHVSGLGGAVAVDLSEFTTHELSLDKDAYRVALSSFGSANFDAALVLDVDGTAERLAFFTSVIDTPAELDHSYDLAGSAADLVLAAGDEWAFVSTEGGKLYAYRTSSSESAGPYFIYDDGGCAEAPRLAASDTLLVTVCAGRVRVWDVDALLRTMGVVAP